MSMLLPPQMLNTIAPSVAGPAAEFTDAWYADPVRRYMLPVFSDRQPEWPSHPYATRDSLHEAEMWAVEGLTHRYPTKVLAELVPTCPQYCGHCTRMDLVGQPHAVVRQAPVHRGARRPAFGDARLPAVHADRAGRGRVRR
jgi:lysine 2,3-aminomutase